MIKYRDIDLNYIYIKYKWYQIVEYRDINLSNTYFIIYKLFYKFRDIDLNCINI